jgi:thiamine transport system ATP-binding protein
MHGASKAQQGIRVRELLELVGLPGAASRAIASLSGGEQQRVALARALAPRPRLLMLDEPLGQLDRSLRERLVVELRELFSELGTTVLAVTHDQVSGEAADTPWGKVPVPAGAPQGEVTLLIRPAGVRLVPPAEGLRCTVAARTFRGTHVSVHLQPESAPRLEAACALRDAPEPGDEVGVAFDAAEIVVLDGAPSI